MNKSLSSGQISDIRSETEAVWGPASSKELPDSDSIIPSIGRRQSSRFVS
jgi:hypothetical protein